MAFELCNMYISCQLFQYPDLLMSYMDETHLQPALCKRSAGVYGLTLTSEFQM